MNPSASSQQTRVAIGADHGGYDLKTTLIRHLEDTGALVIDCGTDGKQPVDYPVFAKSVAERVASGEADFGIMIDGAGIGSAMVANKVTGVRAALCYDLSTARNARQHNDANVLTLGAGQIGAQLAVQITDSFLEARCTEDRHQRRVAMMEPMPRGALASQAPATAPQSQGSEHELPLSADDLKRIADRIRQLMGPQNHATPQGSPAICGQTVCTDCGLCAEKSPDVIRDFIDLGVGRVSHAPGGRAVPKDIAEYIDHTLLKPDATVDEVRRLCAEAREFHFAAVCINPTYVPLAKRELDGAPVNVCTVVGFPLGTHMPEIKGLETRRAIREGAKEIDMVINIGALKSGLDDLVYRDIRMVVEACEDGGALSKVILETALLTDDEKRRACEISKRARADFVKTSTGFGPGGATAEDVALMASVVRPSGMGVKASGGIKSFDDAQKMIRAGATRIGASAGIGIVHGAAEVTLSS